MSRRLISDSTRRTVLKTSAGISGLLTLGSTSAVAQSNTSNTDPHEIEDWNDLDNIRITDEDDDEFVGGLDGEYKLVTDLDEDTQGYSNVVKERTSDGPFVESRGSNVEFEEDDEFTLTRTPLDTVTATDRETNEEVDIEIIDPAAGTVGFEEDPGEEIFNIEFEYITEGDVFVGFEPISGVDDSGNEIGFSGTFDGQGNIIADLEINRPTESLVGLFSQIESDHQIQDISLEKATVTGDTNVGVLAGEIRGREENEISDVSVSGNVIGVNSVGGLIGGSFAYDGNIRNASTEVTVEGQDGVGGLVGEISGGEISNVSADGDLKAERRAGGLIGANSGSKITGASATGQVESTDRRVGGLIGTNSGEITDASATGNVEAERTVGGLVGTNGDGDESNITNVSASGDVTATGDDSVSLRAGGLVGNNRGSDITNASASGDVTGTGSSEVGGLVGNNNGGKITDASVSGDVIAGESHFAIGGLIGRNSSGFWGDVIIESVSASGSVTGGETFVGGLIGQNTGEEIRNASASGTVIGGERNVGGLIGDSSDCIIENVFASGNVEAESGEFGGSRIGGLIGQIDGGEIVNAFAAGDVDADKNQGVGGLVGRNTAENIMKAYAIGDVDGDTNVGGLVGENWADGTISESFATGGVSGNNVTGGLVGILGQVLDEGEESIVENSYWDEQTTGESVAVGEIDEGDGTAELSGEVVGLETDQMQGVEAETNMDVFDFEETWFAVKEGESFNPIATEDGYPILQVIDPQPQLEVQEITDNPDPDPADFSVDITSPDDGEEVTENQALDVTVEVTNIGGEEAEKTVALTAPIESEKDLLLGADETENVTFDIPGDEVDGEVTITVESPDDTDQITVTAVDPCFIATAAYDTPAAQEIDILRDFRDEVLRQHVLGRLFIKTYYRSSPPIAQWIRRNRTRRELVKQYFVEPLVNIVQTRSSIWKRE